MQYPPNGIIMPIYHGRTDGIRYSVSAALYSAKLMLLNETTTQLVTCEKNEIGIHLFLRFTNRSLICTSGVQRSIQSADFLVTLNR